MYYLYKIIIHKKEKAIGDNTSLRMKIRKIYVYTFG